MLNVRVDLFTSELFKYLKDKAGAEAMYEAVTAFIVAHMPEDEIAEVRRRAEVRQMYLDMTRSKDEPSA